MAQPDVSGIRDHLNTYTSYGVGSAAVWGLILAVGRRRLDPDSWKALRLGCAGWSTGWTSATIARAGYPPPKKLAPHAERRLAIVSLALVALGLGGVIRLLATGKRPAAT